jgi:hypothetical protein
MPKSSSIHVPHGSDIAKMLTSTGPVVKCVLLKTKGVSTKADTEEDVKHLAEPENVSDDTSEKRRVLTDLIEEIEVDTSPQKQMVSKILGGTFTFLGQYEDEGIVLMIRNVEFVNPIELPPFNPHQLHPPFDGVEVRGDILIMKVAATDEVLDEEEDEEDDVEDKDVVVPNNDEFFLDYTKDEYIAFASRTDVVAPEPPEEDEDDEDVEDEDDEEEEVDEEYHLGDDETNEEERTAIMNLLMRSILRKFCEDNGRGPNTQELLELRSALAEKMGVRLGEVPSLDEPVAKKKPVMIEPVEAASPYKSILTRRRESEEDDEAEELAPASKRVKFGDESVDASLEEKKGEP